MKLKDKNTTKPTEKSVTTRSSISKRVSTMIDTSKRFLSAHWPKLLSILAVAVFVIGLTFSCGLVNSKAYESFPSGYVPVTFELTTPNVTSTYTFDANGLNTQLVSEESGYTLTYSLGIDGFGHPYEALVTYDGTRFDTAIPCPALPLEMDNYDIVLRASDLTPMFTSSSTSYDISYSPYDYVDISMYTPNIDDEISYIDVIVDYVTYSQYTDPQTGMFIYTPGSSRFQYTLPLAAERDSVSVAEIIRSHNFYIPANSSIQSVRLSLTNMYRNTELTDPDEHPNEQMMVVLSLAPVPEDISRSNFQLLRQRLNTLYGVTGDGSDGSYQQGYDVGYAEGKNAGLTQNLGITRWLTDAGDSVLGMRIFQVHTPHFVDGQYQPLLVDVTLGNILGVFLGGFLLIFILKMFAGG